MSKLRLREVERLISKEQYIYETYKSKRENRNLKKYGHSFKRQIWIAGKGLVDVPNK